MIAEANMLNAPKAIRLQLRKNYSQQSIDALIGLALTSLTQGQSGAMKLEKAVMLAIAVISYTQTLKWARKDIRNRITAAKEAAKSVMELCEQLEK